MKQKLRNSINERRKAVNCALSTAMYSDVFFANAELLTKDNVTYLT
jgi:hypothetical protein